MIEIRDTTGAEAILPFCYGGSNGLLTQDTIDAQLFRGVRHVAAGAHGLRGADRRGQPGALRQDAVVTYQDYSHARLIVLWGVNPSASGIHLVPYVREAQKRGATLVVDRSAHDAAGAAGGSAPRAAGRAPTCRRAGDPPVPVRRRARGRGVPARAHARRRRLRERAPSSGRSSARPRSPASTPAALERVRRDSTRERRRR